MMNESQKKAAAPYQPLVFQQPSKDFVAFVKSFWRGEERLWRSFWLLGISIMVLGLLLVPILLLLGLSSGQIKSAIPVFFLPLYGFWIVAVWRSAFKSSHWIWAIVARAYAVIYGLGILSMALASILNRGSV